MLSLERTRIEQAGQEQVERTRDCRHEGVPPGDRQAAGFVDFAWDLVVEMRQRAGQTVGGEHEPEYPEELGAGS